MRRREERGAGVIGTVLGTGVFLLLMLFAVQVLVGLYTTSVVAAATYDAAKAAAGADAGPATLADAERNAQAQLGDYGRRVVFDWSATTDDVVVLSARGPRPTFLPESLAGPVGLGDIERTVEVRKERVR